MSSTSPWSKPATRSSRVARHLRRQAPQRLIVESTLPNPQQLAYFSNGLVNSGNVGIFFIDYRDVQVAVRTYQARCLAIEFTGRARVATVVNDACPAA